MYRHNCSQNKKVDNTAFAESYYCSGTNCRETKNPAGEGFCSMTPFWCQRVTKLGGGPPNNRTPTMKPQQKYCCSSGCTGVPMNYQKMGDADRCTQSMTTCLFACKHNNANGGFRFCNYTPSTTQTTGVNVASTNC